MQKNKIQSKAYDESSSLHRPEIIVDFIFDEGFFFISIKNIGDKPGYKISVKFNKKIIGVEGSKEVSALPLFKNIEFMPPQKEILTFLDSCASYFKRRQPTKITATISYQDANRKKYTNIIRHDLVIYKEIGYLKRISTETRL